VVIPIEKAAEDREDDDSENRHNDTAPGIEGGDDGLHGGGEEIGV